MSLRVERSQVRQLQVQLPKPRPARHPSAECPCPRASSARPFPARTVGICAGCRERRFYPVAMVLLRGAGDLGSSYKWPKQGSKSVIAPLRGLSPLAYLCTLTPLPL